MNKSHLLELIQRSAQENGGIPPGSRRFYSTTHTRESDWKNKGWNGWNNWGDVLEEAGFPRRPSNSRLERSHIIRQLALLTRKLNRFPVTLDMRREKRVNVDFPNDKTISDAFEGREKVLPALIEFCKADPQFSDLTPILLGTSLSNGFKKSGKPDLNGGGSSQTEDRGWVYLYKAGKYYKLGFTYAPYDRFSTLTKQSSEGGQHIHFFETDDPRGIEAYWLDRFKEKKVETLNKNSGESFNLSSQDVAVFKRRKKFM